MRIRNDRRNKIGVPRSLLHIISKQSMSFMKKVSQSMSSKVPWKSPVLPPKGSVTKTTRPIWGSMSPIINIMCFQTWESKMVDETELDKIEIGLPYLECIDWDHKLSLEWKHYQSVPTKAAERWWREITPRPICSNRVIDFIPRYLMSFIITLRGTPRKFSKKLFEINQNLFSRINSRKYAHRNGLKHI